MDIPILIAALTRRHIATYGQCHKKRPAQRPADIIEEVK